MMKLRMKNCNMILSKKEQKINKYEYLTGDEILPPD